MDLAALQREMAAAVMLPLTPDEQMRAESQDGRAMSDVAASFIAPNSRLSAFERLEIYNRQYWFRVLGALAEDFTALRAVVGASRFEALSIAYLAEHPSRSFTLRNLGSRLPEWLARHKEFTGRRHRLAAEVARLEWAFVEVFDAAERAPLTLEQVATLDGGSRLALQPHIQLLALDYAADELVLRLHEHERRETSEAGVKHEETGDAPVSLSGLRRTRIWLAVHRVDLSIYYRRLQPEEFRMLSAIRLGRPLADAMEDAFTGSRAAVSRRPQMVRDWFATWAELGWICAPELETLVPT
jgi:hypothetical protein